MPKLFQEPSADGSANGSGLLFIVSERTRRLISGHFCNWSVGMKQTVVLTGTQTRSDVLEVLRASPKDTSLKHQFVTKESYFGVISALKANKDHLVVVNCLEAQDRCAHQVSALLSRLGIEFAGPSAEAFTAWNRLTFPKSVADKTAFQAAFMVNSKTKSVFVLGAKDLSCDDVSELVLSKCDNTEEIHGVVAAFLRSSGLDGYGTCSLRESMNGVEVVQVHLGGDISSSSLFGSIVSANGYNLASVLQKLLIGASRVVPFVPRMIIETGKSIKGHHAAIAGRKLYKGEVLCFLDLLPIITENSMYAITRGWGQYFDTTGHPCSRLNHGCDPSVYIDFVDYTCRATRDILDGEELSFNYVFSEYRMAAPFECLCQSPSCMGRIQGFEFLPAATQRELIPLASPWAREMYREKMYN